MPLPISLSPMAVGRAQFHLNNQSRDYSPENASSPLAGNLRPGRTVRIQGTHVGTTYTLYIGRTDEFAVSPAIADKLAEFTALDGLADLAAVDISTAVYPVIRSGAAIGHILDACGWTAGRDIDTGASVFPYWWVDGTDGFSAVKDVVASEGMGAIAYIGPSGEFVFRDRHHRLTRSASSDSQQTFYATGSVEPLFSDPFVYDAGWREVVNTATCDVTERTVASELTEVYADTLIRNIAVGDTLTVNAKLSAVAVDAVTPVAGTDFTLLSGSVNVVLSRTSGQSIDVSITATSAAQLVGLRIRAYQLNTAGTVRVTATDTSSVTTNGVRSLSYDAPWLGANDAVGVLQQLVAQHAERLPAVHITLVGANAARLTQQFARDLSDRITVVEPQTGLDADFHIEQIKHEIDTAIHLTTFGCEKAPSNGSSVFILDTSLLDVGVIGRFIDPDALFILDSSSQGLLGTSILAY